MTMRETDTAIDCELLEACLVAILMTPINPYKGFRQRKKSNQENASRSINQRRLMSRVL